MTVFGRVVSGRRALALLAGAAVALALFVAPGDGSAAGATATASKAKLVKIKGFAYKPKTLRVRRGARVTFKNLDRARHNAVARGKRRFSTGTLRRGNSKTIRFKRRGTYSYLCTFHPFMRGKIVVK